VFSSACDSFWFMTRTESGKCIPVAVFNPVEKKYKAKYRVHQRIGRFLSVTKIKSIGYHDTVTFIRKYIL